MSNSVKNLFRTVEKICSYTKINYNQEFLIATDFLLLKTGTKIKTVDGVFVKTKYGLYLKDNQSYQYNVVFRAMNYCIAKQYSFLL